MESNIASTGGVDYILQYTTGATTSAWTYTGDESYFEGGHGNVNCIRVDKGQPDKAKHVIFYAEINMATGVTDGDPMIFCKDEKQLKSEMKKLLKRKDVDKDSIRIFDLAGGIKKL